MSPGSQSRSFLLFGTIASDLSPGLTPLDPSALIRVPPKLSLLQNPTHCQPRRSPLLNHTMNAGLIAPLIHPSSRQTFAVNGVVLLCLIGQSLFPGVETWLPESSDFRSNVSDCCVAALAKAASGCCCGSTTETSCGCACGTKKASGSTVHVRKQKSTGQSSTIQSEICGCGGKHRPGMICSIEPAVIDALDETFGLQTGQLLLEAFSDWTGKLVPPPTPPPEFCV